MRQLTIREAIEAAGYTPRSYSGRAMYGRTCLGVVVPNPMKAVLDIAAQGVKVPPPKQDSMGLDFIIYWPDIPWSKEESEQSAKRNADHVDGYDRDDLGESPDY